MTAKVILNPYSNRWNAQARWPQAETALQEAGVEFSLAVSEKPHAVTALAEQAAREGFSPLIAAGGDGTVGEVVIGMARAAGSEAQPLGPLGVLPLGTANDLVCNLGLPLDLAEAARVIAAGKTRRLDVCRVNGLYFVNNSAIGLEPTVTLIQQKITRISGIFRYLVAAVKAVMAQPKWTAKIEWDSGQYEGPISLLTVGNSPRTGGIFFMTPHANAFDGKLTFVYGYAGTRLRMFSLLPKAMKPGAGSYVEAPEIHEEHATFIKIHLENPTPAHVDGEIFSEAVQELEYGIQPGRLNIILPEH
jgi:diacylglycerol kinase (ATP)